MVIICIGGILWGWIHYISSLRTSLMDQAVHNVLAVTIQQQRAFDNFLSGDLERPRSFAEYLAQGDSGDDKRIQQWLDTFRYVNPEYLVFNLDTGKFFSNKTYEIGQLGSEELDFYRSFSNILEILAGHDDEQEKIWRSRIRGSFSIFLLHISRIIQMTYTG